MIDNFYIVNRNGEYFARNHYVKPYFIAGWSWEDDLSVADSFSYDAAFTIALILHKETEAETGVWKTGTGKDNIVWVKSHEQV